MSDLKLLKIRDVAQYIQPGYFIRFTENEMVGHVDSLIIMVESLSPQGFRARITF